MVLETTYASRNIGDIFYTLRKDSILNGAVPCTGTEYNISDFSAEEEMNSLAYLMVNNLVSVVNYVEYAAQIKATGCCASFGYDEVNGKFKVPTIKDVYVRAGDSAVLAKYLAAGLPNITGQIVDSNDLAYYPHLFTGAFKFEGTTSEGREANDRDGATVSRITFDASRSSAIYGRADSVQPPSIILRPMVQLVTISAGYSKAPEETDPEPTPPSEPVVYRVPYVFVPGTEAKATEVNANFEYVLNAIQDPIGATPAVHIAGKETVTGQKTFAEPVITRGMEVFPHGDSSVPYIDFHYNGTETDFSSRIFEEIQGYLSLNQSPPSNASDRRIATTAWVNSRVGTTSKGANWMKLHGGLLVQWGKTESVSTSARIINLPTAYTNADFVVIAMDAGLSGSTGWHICSGCSISNTQISLCCDKEGTRIQWVTIGF